MHTYQVVPFRVGQYEAMRIGSFRILTHPWVQGPTVYYQPYGGLAVIEDVDEASNFVAAIEHAASLALTPDETAAFIAETRDQWRTTDA